MSPGPAGARAGRLALLALVALAARPAGACPSCGAGDPTLTAMGAEKPFANRIRLSLEERFGGHAVGSGPGAAHTWSLRSAVSGSWSPTSWLTVAGMVPVVSVWTRSGAGPWRDGTGLGDAELSVRAIVWRDRAFAPRHLAGLLAGLKLPTGPRAYDSTGYPLPPDDQPGSGSFDPIAGASYAWFATERVSLFASASLRWPTSGRQGYRRGETFGATVGVQVQPWERVAGALFAELRWSAADTLPGGTAAPDSGGALLSLTPAVMVAVVPRWLLRLAGQAHVVQAWNGAQREELTLVFSTVVDL